MKTGVRSSLFGCVCSQMQPNKVGRQDSEGLIRQARSFREMSQPVLITPMPVANVIVTGPGAVGVPVPLVQSWVPSSDPAPISGGGVDVLSRTDNIMPELISGDGSSSRPPTGRGTEFSLTIGCTNNVIPGWLDVLKNWFIHFTDAGLASLEVGPKNGHLHIQAIFRKVMSGPANAKAIEALRKSMKGAFGIQRGDGIGCKITLKPFAPGQQWGQMLAYCTKEAGAFHCRTVSFNVSDAEIEAGRLQWSKAKLSYEDGKTVLYKRNIFASTFNFKFVISPRLRMSCLRSLSLLCNSQEIAGAWHASRRNFLCHFDRIFEHVFCYPMRYDAYVLRRTDVHGCCRGTVEVG